MSERLPCPFCGSSDVRVVDSSRGWRTARCYKCFARGPADQSDASPMEDADLIAAWNRRPPPSAVDVEIARLRGVLQAIEGVSSSAIIRSMAHEALSTPTPTDARDAGGSDA